MKARQRLEAYAAILAHCAGEIAKGAIPHDRKPSNEQLFGGPDGALDYDLLQGHADLTNTLLNGSPADQRIASLFEPLYRFALRVTEGHLDVRAAQHKAEAEKPAEPTPAPVLPPKPAGLGEAQVAPEGPGERL